MNPTAQPPGESGKLSAVILDEAADWVLRLRDGEADLAAFTQWRASSPEHTRAWARAEALLGKINAAPPALALPALDRPTDVTRRRLLAHGSKLALLLLLLPAGLIGRRLLEQHGLFAEYRTAAGEKRELHLEDGTQLTLNTATSVDVQLTQSTRLIILRAGEILVSTGHDAPAALPLQIQTQHGTSTPLGTQFTVRRHDTQTRVAVIEGRVRIHPAQAGEAAALTLEAGQQADYNEHSVAAPQPGGDTASNWARGMLLADNMPLGELVAELSRYRPGLIHCTDGVTQWRISGAFPVGNTNATERSLSMLAATYPLHIRQRLGGLWVILDAAQKNRTD